MPYLRLRSRFAEPGVRPARESVVVVSDGEGEVGLVVDRLIGESQSVIKPIGRLLNGLPNVAGTTMLGDGRVALLLDVAAMLRETRHLGGVALTSTSHA
jgi:two-component system, chemotaxis family, sensor kinase CheA